MKRMTQWDLNITQNNNR